MEFWKNFQLHCNIICTFVGNLISAFKVLYNKNVYNNQIIYCFPIIIVIVIVIVIIIIIIIIIIINLNTTRI